MFDRFTNKMQFNCESLDSTLSPSLSETANSYQELTNNEEDDFIIQQTPKRKRNHHCKENKVKRSTPLPGIINYSNAIDVENNKTITVTSSADNISLRKSIEERLNSLCSSPKSPNVSLADIMKTKITNAEIVKITPPASNNNNFLQNTSTQNQNDQIENLESSEEKMCIEEQEQTVSEFNKTDSGKEEIVVEQEQTVSEFNKANSSEEEVPVEQEQSLSKLKHIDFDDYRLIVLEQSADIYLHGVVQIKVIQGCVEVLGYVLSSNSNSVILYSPKGTSFLYIRPLQQNDSVKTDIDAAFTTNEEVLNFIEQQTYDACLILCETVQPRQITYIEKHIAQQIFPKQDNSIGYVFEEHPPEDWNVVNVSSDWDRICDTVGPHYKIFLCGGKGVGKSTFLRYAINRLLMKYEKIRVVDLDPGQPEFTIPGCVSAHTITEPVFGPNYTHIRRAERCIFLPNVNIGYNPKEYIYAIQELLSFYRYEDELPTLINYMGFSLGIGLNIACSVIAEIKPTTVIQIQSKNQKKNFSKLLTPDCVIENMLLPSLLPVHVAPEELSYQFITLDSMSDSCSGFSFQPRQIREMCALAYMSQVLPDDVFSLTDPSVPIYKSSLQNITLIANSVECHPAAVNGNLVALCVKQAVHEDGTIYRCLGWGVVRGIDLNTKEIFLITPESEDTLEIITHLIYGSVNLPPSVYMTADDISGVVPYVSLGTLTSFSSIPKRTHLPKQTKK